MKFRLLVSGGAVSDAQVLAIVHSIEDLAPMYILTEKLLVESLHPHLALCPSCLHGAHAERVCGFRADRNGPACLCTAMDSTPKSARVSLIGPAAFWRRRPPYVVVCGWGILGWLFAGFILLKAFGS